MGPHSALGVEILLVGYERQENLGLRSILAYLRSRGHSGALVPFVPGTEVEVLAAVQALNPRVVGFSVIFQYALDEFAALMRFLRSSGVRAHFTAGGHYPSLQPARALELLPDLDTVVRFEGELTLCELLERLDEPAAWQTIRGLAFRRATFVVITEPRPKILDLDSLPPVSRDEPAEAAPGVKVAAMLASRGCLFDCSFCSIRQFQRSTPGHLRRVRSPQMVVAEMRDLFDTRGIRYFSFQDDDFAAAAPAQRQWVRAFLERLDQAGLSGKVGWKISCRVTDLDPVLLEEMQRRGLIAVYLGVESGSEGGLRALNKRATVGQNRAAIELMKRRGVALAIGFMLFDPSSTVDSVRENIAFLRWAGADGYFPVNFCKMLPYAGTPIEARLRAEGRLKGTDAQPDYAFLDPRLDWYELVVKSIFSRRNFAADGLVVLQQQADFNARLASVFGTGPAQDGYEAKLSEITARTNNQAAETLAELLEALVHHGGEYLAAEQDTLVELAEREWRAEIAAELQLARLGCGDAGERAGAFATVPRTGLTAFADSAVPIVSEKNS